MRARDVQHYRNRFQIKENESCPKCGEEKKIVDEILKFPTLEVKIN